MFVKGDQVRLKIDPNRTGVVTNVIPISESVIKYQVFHNSGKKQVYYEDQLEPLIEIREERFLNLPDFLGQYGAMKFGINSRSTLYSLNTGNIRFIPFQFRPLSRILKAERPRLLIADEVGVGKTIETGLILKEFEKRGAVDTVMIICPKDLTQKWCTEMRNRFNERFRILESKDLKCCISEFGHDGVWPEGYEKCILGLEMVRNKKILEKLMEIEDSPAFSMVILDEAHHVINPSSNSHKIVEYFCQNSDIAVFLSATPLQLGSKDLFSLLNLLLPEEFMDPGIFDSMAEPNQYINGAIRAIRNKDDSEKSKWQKDVLNELSSLECNSWASQVFHDHPVSGYWKKRLEKEVLDDEDRISCLNDLESLHTFAHVINRTKRKDIGEFTTREPYTVEITYTEEEHEFYLAATEFRRSVLYAVHDPRTVNLVMSTIERQITSSLPAFVRALNRYTVSSLLNVSKFTDDLDEEEAEISADEIQELEDMYEDLKEKAKTLPDTDSKMEKLLEIAEDTRLHIENGKLLVFSYFINTLKYLLEVLQDHGIRTALITGASSQEERDEYRARFRLDRDNPEAIDVLLSSEVGCEGLDYEFCSRMVNYDIPWNPMKIEQRIGRIDRFGQKSPKVQIYNFITHGTVEERIFYRCFDRLGIFNSTVGDLESVLGDITKELTEIVFDPTLSDEQMEQRSQQIIDNKIRLHEEQQKYEQESQELFLMDIDQSNSQIESAREQQIEWQKRILTVWMSQQLPKSKLNAKKNGLYEMRISKSERKIFNKIIHDFLKKHDDLKREPSSIQLDKFVTSDEDSIFLNFGDLGESDKKKAYEDSGHLVLNIDSSSTLFQIAVENLGRKDDTGQGEYLSYTCCSAKATDNVPAGHYLFGVYEWDEEGYRASRDLEVILLNQDTGVPLEVTPEIFDSLLLSAQDLPDLGEPEHFQIEEYLHQKQNQEREKLYEENKMLVERKLATINNYYTKCIADAKNRMDKAENKKIRKMHNASIRRLQNQWETEKDTLLEHLNTDILVEPLFYGDLEVWDT